MTTITLYRDSRGKPCGFSVIGHAGMGEQGEDIVCAAISALSQTAANTLETVARIHPIVHIGEGFLSVRLPKGLGRSARYKASIILRTAQQGFLDIAASYAKYIRISNKN